LDKGLDSFFFCFKFKYSSYLILLFHFPNPNKIVVHHDTKCSCRDKASQITWAQWQVKRAIRHLTYSHLRSDSLVSFISRLYYSRCILTHWFWFRLIDYCQTNQDMMVPSVWGTRNPDPFAEPTAGCGCSIM
jgi:hypothetical protein